MEEARRPEYHLYLIVPDNRQDFMKQIKEGCLLLPGAFKLADVVNTDIDSMVSMEIESSYGKEAETE